MSKKCPSLLADIKVMSLSKTDVRYWQGAVSRFAYTKDGEKREVSDWSIKIQHAGRRETFALGTPNKAAAAAKAKEIYLSLQGKGWAATIVRFKKGSALGNVLTVGEFIESARSKFGGRPKTFEDYARAFRTILADVFGIDGGKEKYGVGTLYNL